MSIYCSAGLLAIFPLWLNDPLVPQGPSERFVNRGKVVEARRGYAEFCEMAVLSRFVCGVSGRGMVNGWALGALWIQNPIRTEILASCVKVECAKLPG